MMTTFSILTVCSGNICRSPLAEQLLRVGLGSLPGVSLASAGTIGLTGRGMPEQAAALSRQFGGEPSAHVARELTVEHLISSNLVLAMSREHRRAIAELSPRAIRYTFTIREFARLVHDLTAADLTAVAGLPLDDLAGRFASVVELAASQRGMVPPAEKPDDDDVVDPYRQNDGVYAESAAQLVPAVNALVSLLQRAATIV
ncbi:low molecular weight phosphatase family protein [Cryobacterium sp. Hb1]|uniref:arsenate reductase/protein-tyrosine-phosphatase family protein n=1 Tax=Cryobacterium sp. Hb1 TaxID=1259147 RepID=UPI00106D02B1|nr:low molecular weight phosphatase family protein [Cryobacterium sp. Hb1]TFD70123.1 low molecular weight phosphatase family protein [Cryobacterium sp. Hb1]